MNKTADRLDRMEKLLEELVSLMRILVLRGGENLPTDDEVRDITIPSIPPHLPPTLPPAEPKTPPVFPQPWQPSKTPTFPDVKAICGKCGMVFEGIMGYVCQDPACPMGCGPVTC